MLRDGVGERYQFPRILDQGSPARGENPARIPADRLGRFTRDGREIMVVVNVGTQAYEGQLSPPTSGDWLSLDPATGAVERAEINEHGDLSLVLEARQTRLLVGQASPR